MYYVYIAHTHTHECVCFGRIKRYSEFFVSVSVCSHLLQYDIYVVVTLIISLTYHERQTHNRVKYYTEEHAELKSNKKDKCNNRKIIALNRVTQRLENGVFAVLYKCVIMCDK